MRVVLLGLLSLSAACTSSSTLPASVDTDEPPPSTFEVGHPEPVRELFSSVCTGCHETLGPDAASLQDPMELVNAPSDGGTPLITPGNPQASLIYLKATGSHAFRGESGTEMPPLESAILATEDQEIVLRRWILDDPTLQPETPDLEHDPQVEALLDTHCRSCHGTSATTLPPAIDMVGAPGQFRTWETLVEPGRPWQSLLYRHTYSHVDTDEPWSRTLDDDALEDIYDWILGTL